MAKAREASEVAAHLADCAACRLKAEEFEASGRLLALHAPPVFDENFYASVRRNVMREIEAEQTRPAPFAAFRQLFAPRTLAVAASLALLVACALVAFQLYRRVAPTPQTARETARQTNTHADEAPPEKTNNAPAPVVRQHEQVEDAPVVAQHDEPRRRSLGAIERASSRTRHVASQHAQSMAHASAPTVESSASNQTGQPTQLETVAVNQAAPLTEIAERKLTRIELQTADPNVRIIWLSPRADDTPAIQRETKR